VIYLRLAVASWTLQIGQAWNDDGWREFEDFLCRLTEERLDDGEPLVLELGIQRNHLSPTHGPLDPGKMLPRFRERGLIRFVVP
jgi:hypothetical protein